MTLFTSRFLKIIALKHDISRLLSLWGFLKLCAQGKCLTPLILVWDKLFCFGSVSPSLWNEYQGHL